MELLYINFTLAYIIYVHKNNNKRSCIKNKWLLTAAACVDIALATNDHFSQQSSSYRATTETVSSARLILALFLRAEHLQKLPNKKMHNIKNIFAALYTTEHQMITLIHFHHDSVSPTFRNLQLSLNQHQPPNQFELPLFRYPQSSSRHLVVQMTPYPRVSSGNINVTSIKLLQY